MYAIVDFTSPSVEVICINNYEEGLKEVYKAGLNEMGLCLVAAFPIPGRFAKTENMF